MKMIVRDYIEVSEDDLLRDVELAYFALDAFLQRLDGEIFLEDEYQPGETRPLIVGVFRELYLYASGTISIPDCLDSSMSMAISFTIMAAELSDGFESGQAPSPSYMIQTVAQAYARFKIDLHFGRVSSILLESIHSVFEEEDTDLEGLSTLQLGMLARLKQQSVRNKLSLKSGFSLEKNEMGKYFMNVKDAIKWLGEEIGYSTANSEDVPVGETLNVPVARDGSFFNVKVRSPSGYRIGKKGSEILIEDFNKALEELAKMPSPYWRRPSKESGVPGVVKGIRWERKLVSDVMD